VEVRVLSTAPFLEEGIDFISFSPAGSAAPR
jgi:hypothetical protein